MAETAEALKLTVLSDLEIQMSRVFNAPRELVWKALTDPEAIPQWWGPRGVKTVVDRMDVRVGGAWRYIHVGDDGENAFRGEYKELTPPERIVYTFEWEPMAGHVITETATLEDIGGKTRITVVSRFQSKEDRDGMLASGMEQGAAETWDRLAELLATMS